MYGLGMTHHRRNTDTSRATAAARAVNHRKRARRAAEQLRDLAADVWPDDARAVLTELGHRALQEIDRQDRSAR